MSDFIESVDDMIAHHFASWTMGILDNKPITEEMVYRLIRTSITHARSQIEGRNMGTMTFDAAMQLIRTQRVMVTRPSWDIFRAVRLDEEYSGAYYIGDWHLDNCDGIWSGVGHKYTPTDEDRAATDWMVYQTPQENWVELEYE